MKKTEPKIIVVILIALLITVLGLTLNVVIKKKFINTYTYAELEYRGYPTKSISEIDIKHSYVNKILGFNEWRIFVVFEKKPYITFCFTYKNQEILFQGVRAEPMPDKDKIIEYSEKFKNGTLLDD